MTNEPEDKLTGLFAQAVQQLIRTPGADDRPEDLDAVVLREISRTDGSPGRWPSKTGTQTKRTKPLTRLVKYSLAALLLIAAGAVGWFGLVADNNSVYGAVAERLEKLHSMVYRVQWVDEAGLANAVEGDGDEVMYLAPSHFRIEKSNGSVIVIDTDAEKGIYLTPATKTAAMLNGQLAGSLAAISRGPIPLIDTLRQHFHVGREPSDGIEELGEKEIGNIQAKGLRSTVDGEIVEAWIDPDTSLPVEIRIRLTIPAHLSGSANQPIRMWRIVTNLEYDVTVDRSLMSIEVPVGYTAIEMPQLSAAENATKPSLTDLIDLLRLCAKHNGSRFPVSLSMNDTPGTCMAIMKRFASSQDKVSASQADAEKQAAMEATIEFGTAMGRATRFLFSLGPKNKVRYVGERVKLGTPDKPILWFSPAGGAPYQVIYADLSVREVAESALPQWPATAQSRSPRRTVITSTSPRVVLPRSAVKDFNTLQTIRKAGKQDAVRFLELQWMPEFIEAGPSAKSKYSNKNDHESSRLEFLAEFRNLEGLRVDSLFLTETDLKRIGDCRSLKRLSLSGIQVLETPQGKHRLRAAELRYLRKLTNLEVLDLSQSQFAGGLQHLSALPKLHTVILSSFEHLNDASIAELKQLPHLQTLVLAPVYGSNPERTVTAAGLESLKEISRLQTLYVGYHGKWTIPIDELQSLLPNVNIRRGFQVQTTGDPGVSPELPIPE